MATIPSAMNQDPTLYCQYFGGPEDGRKTGDLPVTLSGRKLTGMTMKTPLWQPASAANYAVYVCTSEHQVDGFWRLEYTGIEGPNGEALVAEQHRCAADALTQLADIAQAWSERAAKHSGDVAPGA